MPVINCTQYSVVCAPRVPRGRLPFRTVAPRGLLRIPALTDFYIGPRRLLVALPMYANRTPAAQTLRQFASNSAHEQNCQRE